MRARALLLAAAFVGSACSTPPVIVRAPHGESAEPGSSRADEELESLLRGDPELAAALDDAPRRRLQVLVAIPTEDAQGNRGLRRLGFRVDAEYFYPASSVKLAVAVAAVEKLDEQRGARGKNLVDLSTPLRVTESGGSRKKIVETTLRDELEKALVVSDNDAHNRLYELVGRDELAERLGRIGLRSTRIVQRLGDGSDAPAPAFEWLPASGEPIYVAQRLSREEAVTVDDEEELVGTAYVDGAGRRVSGPMDFSAKNRMTLRDLQDMLVMTVCPELADGAAPRLAPPDRTALLAILGTLPSELRPRHYTAEGDAMHKPMHAAIVAALPDDRVQVYGKGGRAFGFAVENTYAVDETTGRSFFVTAAMYANGNDTLNDDRYEYKALAEPFMARLATALARALLAGGRSTSGVACR